MRSQPPTTRSSIARRRRDSSGCFETYSRRADLVPRNEPPPAPTPLRVSKQNIRCKDTEDPAGIADSRGDDSGSVAEKARLDEISLELFLLSESMVVIIDSVRATLSSYRLLFANEIGLSHLIKT